VKLLFDENLSPRLVDLLEDIYPGPLHVHDCGFGAKADSSIWEFAERQGLTIVTKDSDFRNKSLLRGSPPKVIWLSTHNCSTAYVEFLIRASSTLIGRFALQDNEACLILGRVRKIR
jgi:predicted nuclease of predicted toxin-antitoxin system